MSEKTVFATGATGYVGRALIPRLLARGHHVLALARGGSERRLPDGSEAVTGDALDAATYRVRVPRERRSCISSASHIRWPYVLLPLYALLEVLPPTRAGARRLGLVTLGQMTAALVEAVETPPTGVRIVTAPEIRGAPPGG